MLTVRGARDEARVAWRLVRGLVPLLSHPVDLPRARAVLRERLERRAADLLWIARHAIYERPSSPYLQLLDAAGCAYADLERLVAREGVEGALRELLRNGVYLTVDEFKGRRPVRRGPLTLETSPDALRNPWSTFHLPSRTSGSRGAATPVLVDLDFIRDRAVNTAITFAARGGGDWSHGFWGVPGGSAIVRVVEFSAFGAPPARWFSQVAMGAPGLHPRYRWSARAIRGASLLARAPIPAPEHVPFDNPAPIVRWLTETRQAGRVPHLHTFASSVVQVCEAARDAGVDLRGVQFTLASEPTTAARLAAVRRTGASAQPCYAITDFGIMGYGCLSPAAPDDVHLFHDLNAVIQPDAALPALPARSLLVTSLRRTAPFILLNVSAGDLAVTDRRQCACPLEAAGWPEHLHSIRSFEKLTAGGMTFLDTDLARVLEEVLPEHFGGGPTDYQLAEEESDGGRPTIRLLVHPRVGPVDAIAVSRVFLDAIGSGSGAEKVMQLAWREARFLSVERRPPRLTPLGKVLHLHTNRAAAAPPA
jgi:hypothetical protein